MNFAGLFSLQNIRFQINNYTSVFQSLNLDIGSITIKKIPKRLGIAICIRKPTIKLGFKPLDLSLTGNVSNLLRMAMNESGQDLIMKNSLEMLNFVRNLYYHQQKKTSAKKSLTSPLAQQEPKKKSINDNKEFFRQMSIRILVMVVMKLTTIEVTDLHFEIVQVNAKDYQPKPMFKLQVTKYNMYFEYQKVRRLIIESLLRILD